MPQTFRARAALLDMDGTLVDSSTVVERLWLEWAEPHGLDPEYVLSVIHGRQGHLSMAIMLPDRPHEQNITENRSMLRAESADVDGVVEIPGAGAFLAAIAPFPHAIVTSADDRLLRVRMDAARLAVPGSPVTAEHVHASKPDPEGFLLGAERLGVDPADCIVFEDSSAGIAAARAAGMRVIGVGAGSAAHSPDAVVPDFTHVRVEADGDGFLLALD
ncbi:HAD-IA family hydrolase [Microbacterium capsulatum]|uniref:HAD-IA family hydrolase n=1 Tax=Microbacterium capsulatum TaxID=3041921 RepID=A0ABU0XJ61_9MICO|nr:HAD-IA family hydrolase [Microbacterium sp. ASV81]MDQ4214623.1 HAD-IA family hydrolase [Microbacterium sp. ASV81]